jgi:hypothetical protein
MEWEVYLRATHLQLALLKGPSISSFGVLAPEDGQRIALWTEIAIVKPHSEDSKLPLSCASQSFASSLGARTLAQTSISKTHQSQRSHSQASFGVESPGFLPLHHGSTYTASFSGTTACSINGCYSVNRGIHWQSRIWSPRLCNGIDSVTSITFSAACSHLPASHIQRRHGRAKLCECEDPTPQLPAPARRGLSRPYSG